MHGLFHLPLNRSAAGPRPPQRQPELRLQKPRRPWAIHVAAFLCLTALVLFSTSCGKKSVPDLLAKVGSSEIRVTRFQEQMARRGGARPEALDKGALLEEMIDQEALYVKALQRGLHDDPEVQRAYRNLLIGKLKDRELTPQIEKAEITAEEIRTYYETNRARYIRPAKVRLAVLTLKTSPATSAENVSALRQRMTEARQKAMEPAAANERGFGALAIAYSEDQASRYRGGEVGWIEEDRGHAWLSPAVIAAGFALKQAGAVSEVLADPQGVYLVRLLERRNAEVIPVTEVEATIRQQLLTEKRRQLERAFVAQARAAVPVEIHPELLARITPPTAAPEAANLQPPSFP